MTDYTVPVARSYGHKITANQDYNILVQDIKNHEDRIVALEAAPGITEATNVPIGGIIMWSGSIASIPAHWALCDGTSGTPDLTDRFVVGAGSSYAVDDTGGVTSHSHSGGSTSTGGSHTHSISGNTSTNSTTNSAQSGVIDVAADGHYHSYSGTSSSSGSHSHTTGDSGSASNLPPYYALAFIMRTD